MGFIGEIQYADTHFNVIRAALMRRSRIEAKKHAVHLRKLNGFLIMNLPLEIIFSIFEYLHPIDIYHLSLSSPIFQNLLNDQPTFLKNLYQSHGIPLWPLDIPYERWSDLLFGDAICDRCQKYIALPDFVHRQRICSNCFQTGFSYTYPSGMIVPKGYRQCQCIPTPLLST
ncbi:hypothetical protein BDN72DRAFT_843591 [Pluteus cervinus]|uniref:Uncharacterized protein n=1 Tax=Pluteus cervinus TaxID=181527 RepID=A0ACD3ANX9_9AGAR|nr:hypothetical protein BDN72DRAFT_843591 [Pluteus cervinus]